MKQEAGRLPSRVLWQIFAAVGFAIASIANAFGGDVILAIWFGVTTAVTAVSVAFGVRDFRR